MTELMRCSKCLTPETHETISFDKEGVCNICRQSQYKNEKINWEKRELELIQLLEEHRGKYDYDCIVPFSGGKDSTYTLLKLVKDYKLKPLVVCFDHGFMRPTVISNRTRTFRKLGVDVHTFTPNWKIMKRTMLESLVRKGDFCWHCHVGICAYPMQVAIKYNVPVVIWGEPSAEYTSYYDYEDGVEEVNEERLLKVVNITAEDMTGMLGSDVSENDLLPYTYPKLKDLKKLKYQSFCLGSYIPWDVKEQVKRIETELGWQEEVVEGVCPGYGYEKIECMFQGVRDYLKYIKRGYARVSHLTSIDIRNGRIDRETGLALVKEYEGKRPASLDVFLEYLEITEEQFNEIALQHMVHPNQVDPAQLEKGSELWDQQLWYRETQLVNPIKLITEKNFR